jgi:hypothetical protein
MKHVFTIFILLILSLPAAAQWLDLPWPGIPRTTDGAPDLAAPAPRMADGKPDLTGLWNGPPPVADLDPAILQPWVADLARERQVEYYKARPLFTCLPNGPETESAGGWKRYVQTSDMLVILNEDLTWRVIHLDGRELEANPFPSFAGHSVGHWEGNTLVIDTNGFNDQTWVSRYGVSHTEALRVTERITRSDFGHLQIETTFTDPEAFTRSWGYTSAMRLQADTGMLESVCERGSEAWEGRLTDAADKGVTVSPDILERYVGSYRGIYTDGPRTYEVTLSGNELIAKIVGNYSALGLGAAGLEQGVPRTLVPLSETLFDGLGLSYRFVVNDDGEVESFVLSHVSGDYTYSRLP